MSRIQDILAKADREGTASRVSARPVAARGLQDVETAVLTRAPFTPAPEPPAPRARTDVRRAAATLHPSLVAAIAPHAEAAERYRSIRARLTQREEAGPLRTIAVTSPGGREGKSMTAANLALTMAQEPQRRVVLVDGNVRSPSVHALFAVDREPGFTDVLMGAVSLDEALVYVPELRLTLLPAGRLPDYPTELLGSSAMRRALDALGERFDRIVLDLPAVMPLADVGTVAPLADGVVMVVRAGRTQRPALERALGAFEEGAMLGIVINEGT